MKKLLLVLIVLKSTLLIAQSDSISKNMDTLYLISGYKIIVGQDLKIGSGSTPNGSFKYIRSNTSSLFAYTSQTTNNADNANNLPRDMSGMSLKVKRIEKRGSKKMGYVYYPILKKSLLAYECDIRNAIISNEIEVPDEFKPKEKPVVIISKISAADEILKYKKLMDAGVLTKEEFETKKKKLLEEN